VTNAADAPDAAVELGVAGGAAADSRLTAQEVLVLDFGGQSTRPGSEPISLEEERARRACVERDAAEAITGWLEEPSVARRMGQAAQARAERLFRWSRTMAGVEAVYKEAVGKAGETWS
jgi:dihydropteroate synthase